MHIHKQIQRIFDKLDKTGNFNLFLHIRSYQGHRIITLEIVSIKSLSNIELKLTYTCKDSNTNPSWVIDYPDGKQTILNEFLNCHAISIVDYMTLDRYSG